MTETTTRIFQCKMDADRVAVRDMWEEYLLWACARIEAEFGVVFDVPAILERDMQQIGIFDPPAGRLLLVTVDTESGAQVAGCASMKRSTEGCAEIKRMYVRPTFRRRGIGHALVTALIEAAQSEGYHTVRLDSNRFMTDAHALYHAAGFEDIEPYPESEIPPEYWPYWVFMEKPLK